MEEQDIDFESRKHLFVDAGTLAPGFSLAMTGLSSLYIPRSLNTRTKAMTCEIPAL